MELKTFALGFIPPLLALTAELLNPISETTLSPQSETTSARVVYDVGRPTLEVAENTRSIADVITKTVIGAVEISALIPTWISATAGITAILIDTINPCLATAIVAIWAAFSAISGIKYFSSVNYYATGNDKGTLTLCRRLTKARCLSWCLVGVNIIVIAFVVGVAGYQWVYEGKENKTTAAVLAPSSALSCRFDTGARVGDCHGYLYDFITSRTLPTLIETKAAVVAALDDQP
jgi:hypothetical protein